MNATACPDRDVLQRLLLGRLSPAESEQLAQHLEGCARCASVARTFHAEDTLVEAARSQATVADGPEGEQVRRLIDRLRRAGPPAPEQGTLAGPPEQTAEAAIPPPAAPPRYEFLAPPQGAGELGRLGGYRVLKVLGSGGMGVVFQAEDVALKRPVALKVMRPEAAGKPGARERFLREARAAAALEHENVVTIYQVGEERGVPFIAMQWLKGMSLEERLKRTGPLTVPQVLRLGRQAARGLAAAHAAGLIHRDVKPANLWLEPEGGGRVRILDFGLARAVQDDAHLTESGAIVGTPAYMAPGQAQGAGVDHRCDLFSLGAVLYRMCTGQLPFRGDNTLAVLCALVTETPRPVRELNPAVPPALAELVTQLLAKDPADRPASAREVVERLQAVEREYAVPVAAVAALAETEVLPPPPPPAPPVPPKVRRPARRRLLLAGAAALLALVALGWYFGGTVLRVATNKGVLVIESDDPNLEVTVKGPTATVHDKVKDRRFVLSAGDYEVEVREEGDGGVRFATKKFTITRGGKETFNARLELAKAKPPEQKPALTDRQAAEWVLSLGGKVMARVGDKEQEVGAAKDLPAAPFLLVGADLAGNPQVSDTGLEHLKGLSNLSGLELASTRVGDAGLERFKTLTHLSRLGLSGTHVTDVGLRHLQPLTNLQSLDLSKARVSDAGLKQLRALPRLVGLHVGGPQISDAGVADLGALTQLEYLSLRNSRVSDAGLAHLKGLTKLKELDLGRTQVSDAGLERLQALPSLTMINLDWTPVTDAGLKHLEALPNLRGLGLAGPQITDAWLARLKGLPNLTSVALNTTRVSDAGLGHLKALPKLNVLHLIGTPVSDAGLKHLEALQELFNLHLGETRVSDAGLKSLAALPNLNTLDLSGTRVSARGLATLKTALPQLRIRGWWEPNRTAAEAVLALGGTVHVRPEGGAADRIVKAAGDLPAEYFRLTRAGLAGVNKPLADLWPKLANLTDPDFDRLEALDLAGTALADADLPALRPLTALTELSLARTQVSDAGLAALKELKGLRRLDLDGAPVRGRDLADLGALPNLTELRLGCPTLTDLVLGRLGELKRLERLSLAGSGVTDAGLEALHGLTDLKDLDLSGTKVTAAGVAALRKALAQCHVVTDSGSDERQAAEWVLSLGGTVGARTATGYRQVRAVKDLPAAFRLETIYLAGNSRVSDAALAHLAGLTNLEHLGLAGTPVGGAGLEHLKGLTSLRALELHGSPVRDAGLAHLRGLTNLRYLNLGGTRVTDAGLEHLGALRNLESLALSGARVRGPGLKHLQGLSKLRQLHLSSTPVDDAALVHVEGLTTLRRLDLDDTRVSDAGLVHLKGLKALVKLALHNTRVGDAGLAHLQGLTKLQSLGLRDTQVTDAALGQLKGLTTLSDLDLTGTKLTAEGVAALRNALPGCRISGPAAK